MRAIFGWSRYLIMIAVIALLLGALAVFVFGGITMVVSIIEVFAEGEFNADGARFLSVEMIELIDLFLLGTILYITSLGLYQLFVDPAIGEILPSWLSVHSIDQLKFNLVAVLVVMLIVLFLGAAAETHLTGTEGAGVELLAYGAGIALVVAAAGAVVMMLGDVVGEMEERHEEAHQELHGPGTEGAAGSEEGHAGH